MNTSNSAPSLLFLEQFCIHKYSMSFLYLLSRAYAHLPRSVKSFALRKDRYALAIQLLLIFAVGFRFVYTVGTYKKVSNLNCLQYMQRTNMYTSKIYRSCLSFCVQVMIGAISDLIIKKFTYVHPIVLLFYRYRGIGRLFMNRFIMQYVQQRSQEHDQCQGGVWTFLLIGQNRSSNQRSGMNLEVQFHNFRARAARESKFSF